MNPDVRDRRLIGYIWDCGDSDCECRQPVIDEVWLVKVCYYESKSPQDEPLEEVVVWEERRERFWEGTWMAEPASWDMEVLRDELTGACERHNMERDGWNSDRWEREL